VWVENGPDLRAALESGTPRDPQDEPFSLRYLKEWAENGPDLWTAVESEGEPVQEEVLVPIILEEIINNKKRQILIEPSEGGITRSEFNAYRMIKQVTIKLNMGNSDEDLIGLLR
jgi:hypothetical protein